MAHYLKEQFYQEIRQYKEGGDYLPLLTDYLEATSRVRDQDIHRELLALVVDKFVALEKQVDNLLKNTLPPMVAEEIRYLGNFAPRQYDCTILFSDVAGFTRLAEELSSVELVAIIDEIFRIFDQVVRDFNGTKIKTIGDAYMVVFGAPVADEDHPARAVRAALAMQEGLAVLNRQRFGAATAQYFGCRIGIHSGQVTAGVVGEDRMQFDVFGDHVNIAARFETAGEPGRVNISAATRQHLPPNLVCQDRGEVALKHKKAMPAYFVREQSAEPGSQEGGLDGTA